jgi:signal transduction histidine kinase
MLNMPLMRKIWTDFAPILKEHAWRSPEALYGGLTYGFLKDHFEPLLMDVEMATQRIARIVTQLKDFSRQSKVNEVGPVQLNEAVENAARLSMSTVKKSGVQLELNLDRELPSMEGNLPCLEQVTLNLIINAFEAIDHPNGRIAVTTQLEPSTQRIILSVADNGRGVHPTIAEQIFDPFVTDKQNQGGTGLGLAITYNLVKAHRGDIEFQSRRGSGTTFTVTFPIEGEGSTAWNICHLENQPF